jgi:hypothetical protein
VKLPYFSALVLVALLRQIESGLDDELGAVREGEALGTRSSSALARGCALGDIFLALDTQRDHLSKAPSVVGAARHMLARRGPSRHVQAAESVV